MGNYIKRMDVYRRDWIPLTKKKRRKKWHVYVVGTWQQCLLFKIFGNRYNRLLLTDCDFSVVAISDLGIANKFRLCNLNYFPVSNQIIDFEAKGMPLRVPGSIHSYRHIGSGEAFTKV